MSTTLVELSKEFRCMLLRVTDRLSDGECAKIAFIEHLPQFTPNSCNPMFNNIRIHVLHQLEARRCFSPLSPDGLIDLLKRIHRYDLMYDELQRYKESELFKKAKKEQEKPKKKSLIRKKKGEDKSTPKTELSQEGQELLALKRTTGHKHQMKELFALTMTVVSDLLRKVEDIRVIIDKQDKQEIDLASLERAFEVVTEKGEFVEKFGRVMRQAISDSGLRSSNSSNSSIGAKSTSTGSPTGKMVYMVLAALTNTAVSTTTIFLFV